MFSPLYVIIKLLRYLVIMHRLSLIFLFSYLLFAGCKKSQRPQIAWYHWSSSMDIYNARHFNEIHGNQKLYVRLFDVKWHTVYGAYPEASFSTEYPLDTLFSEVVPVVYITNEALINIAEDSIPSLHRKMKIQIATQLRSNLPNHDIHELQFDCDWTARSRVKYFRLLKLFGESEQYVISATVKLWQYAYREKAGIPPCDRVVLMCYNISNPRENKVKNSIFDAEEVKKYLKNKFYPLPLDIALPNFSWAVLFRNGEFRGLLNQEDSTSITRWPIILSKPNHYIFQKDYDDYSHFFKEGDELRLEAAGPDDIYAIASDLSELLNDKNSTLILYNFEQFNHGIYAHDSLFVDRFLDHF